MILLVFARVRLSLSSVTFFSECCKSLSEVVPLAYLDRVDSNFSRCARQNNLFINCCLVAINYRFIVSE